MNQATIIGKGMEEERLCRIFKEAYRRATQKRIEDDWRELWDRFRRKLKQRVEYERQSFCPDI